MPKIKRKRRFIPDLIAESVYDIDMGLLRSWGVRGLIFDIDNTLAPYDQPSPSPQSAAYLKGLLNAGFKVCLISNNNRDRVELFNEALGLPVYPKARKPFTKALRAAAREMELDRGQVAVIGDQIFTDVYAARRAGMRAVLVRPIKGAENAFFRLKRAGERPFIRKYYKLERKRTEENGLRRQGRK